MTIAFYRGDSRCRHWLGHHGRHSRHHGHSGDGHNRNTSIRHLGYHLAWTIWSHYSRRGRRIDLVGHSLGGLIIRYALAQVERNHPRFPRYLLVEDAVTLATPHAGAGWANLCGWKQCEEMRPRSGFIAWLRRRGAHPDGRGRTDWTSIGSHSDFVVSAASANAMHSDHRLKYRQSNNPAVGHMTMLGLGSARTTADVERSTRPLARGPHVALADPQGRPRRHVREPLEPCSSHPACFSLWRERRQRTREDTWPPSDGQT